MLVGLCTLTLAIPNLSEASAAHSPVESATESYDALASGDYGRLWDAVPEGERNSIENEFHEYARTIDPDLWRSIVHAIRLSLMVRAEKREFVRARELAIQAQGGKGGSAGLSVDYETLLAAVAFSELSDLQTVQVLDLGEFFRSASARALLGYVISPKQLADYKAATITLVTEDDAKGTATVRIASGGKIQDRNMVLVEGRWVFSEVLATSAEGGGYNEKLAEFRSAMAYASRADTKEKIRKIVKVSPKRETCGRRRTRLRGTVLYSGKIRSPRVEKPRHAGSGHCRKAHHGLRAPSTARAGRLDRSSNCARHSGKRTG